MKLLDFIHRWTGGIIGLLLAVLGLSGAILAHKDMWVSAPGAGDIRPQTLETSTRLVEKLMADPATRPDYVLMASDNFGLHRLSYGGDKGAYANHAGEIVARWDSVWDRPELWLFDLHHHLFAGDTGELVAAIAGLIGLGFVITGAILWWRLRRTFKFRLWPKRMSRPAIVHQHRDLGIVFAPLLFLSCLTGAMMVLKPVAGLVLSPWSSPAEMLAASRPPKVKGGALAAKPDWRGMMAEAHRHFPDAEFRMVGGPRKPGDLVGMRMKQSGEWLPNGRSMVWFKPETGKLVEARDAFTQPAGYQLFNKVYPLHAGKVGGLAWRIMITLSGLALTVLGSFAVWSFWFRRNQGKVKRLKPAIA